MLWLTSLRSFIASGGFKVGCHFYGSFGLDSFCSANVRCFALRGGALFDDLHSIFLGGGDEMRRHVNSFAGQSSNSNSMRSLNENSGVSTGASQLVVPLTSSIVSELRKNPVSNKSFAPKQQQMKFPPIERGMARDLLSRGFGSKESAEQCIFNLKSERPSVNWHELQGRLCTVSQKGGGEDYGYRLLSDAILRVGVQGNTPSVDLSLQSHLNNL